MKQEYVYIGIGAAAFVIACVIVAVCVWHRRRRRMLADERVSLLSPNHRVDHVQERALHQRATATADLSTLDSESWKRIDTWLTEVCDFHARRQILPIEEPEIEPEHTPSASLARGLQLKGPSSNENDGGLPSTPRQLGSPRVSVGASDGIGPSSRKTGATAGR